MQTPNIFMSRKITPSCFMLLNFCITFALTTNSQGPQNVPSQGLLCISECTTCPIICSPPPSPASSKPDPFPPISPPSAPSPTLSPPSHPSLSPPRSVHQNPPPQWYYFPSPPASSYEPPISASPTPKPSVSAPPPPPPPASRNLPTVVQTPPDGGQRNYTYPYYYFYVSGASSVSLGDWFFVYMSSVLVLFVQRFYCDH